MTRDKLILQNIQTKRKQLEKCGLDFGLTDLRTVHLSKELDRMITEYTKKQTKEAIIKNCEPYKKK